jgi:hypothetical protein
MTFTEPPLPVKAAESTSFLVHRDSPTQIALIAYLKEET